jgi:hypothetical protein
VHTRIPELCVVVDEEPAMSADALIVPKAEVPVELRDSRGRQHGGELFVGSDGDERESLQSVLLARRFVPMRGPGGAVEMLNRDHLLWVRLDLLTALDEIDLEAEAAAESRTANLRVALDDGTVLDGLVRYLRPSHQQRLSDYLQSVPAYFPVRTADHVYLVNRDHVMSVAPLLEVVR